MLRDAPHLKNSAIEVELRRMDERDSRWAVLPSVNLRTRYFIDPPEDPPDQEPYAVDFVIESTNPVEKYYTIEVRRILTRMAVLRHLQVLAESLERLGAVFLDLQGLDESEDLARRGVALLERQAAYLRARLETGAVTPLDLRAAELEQQGLNAELERIATARRSALLGLQGLLGLPSDLLPAPLPADSLRQIAEDFDPAAVPWQEVKEHAFELRVQSLKLALQRCHVILARARYLPNLLLGLQTTDPLGSRADNGLFFSVGFDLPLWDGLRRYHDIERQQTVLRQYQVEEQLGAVGLAGRWTGACDRLAECALQRRLAHSRLELAEAREKQVESHFQVGREPFAALLNERRQGLDAHRQLAARALEERKALLSLFRLSGRLLQRYVHAGAWQEGMEGF
jgi:outer membrane protein TolC